MKAKTKIRPVIAAIAVVLLFGAAPAAKALVTYEYYGGYNDVYDDDWFYDYYDYSYDYYPDYGYYDYAYDYDADLFDWEEDGLFD